MTVERLNNGELAESWREKLNRVIDIANESLNPNTFVGPQGPKGDQGERGEKGDIGNYAGIALQDVVDSPEDLANIGMPTVGMGAGVDTGQGLDVYVYTADGWTNYGPLTAQEQRDRAEMIYVSPNGDDDASGRTWSKSLRTIEAAQELSTQMSGPQGPGARPTTVMVYPGEYPITGNIAWPDKCSVIGLGGARKTRIVPAEGMGSDGDIPYKNKNAFLLGDGGYVDGFSFNNFEIYNYEEPSRPFDNPTSGFAIAFRPGALINRVPYAHNITAYKTWPPRSLISGPHDRKNGNPGVPVGGGVCIADGSIISMYSAFPNIMTWGATPSTPNGVGYLATKGGFLNPINAICLFAHKHFMVKDGAQMVLSGCSSQFGDYSLWSEGSLFSIIPRKATVPIIAQPTISGALKQYEEQIVNDLWLYINKGNIDIIYPENLCGCTCSVEEYEASYRRDMGYLINALFLGLSWGSPAPIDQFIRGLYDWNGKFVSSPDCLVDWADQYRYLYNDILPKYIGNVDALAALEVMLEMIAGTLDDTNKPSAARNNLKRERSLLTSINHQWTFPLAGVSRYATPSRFRNAGKASVIRRSIKQREGGRVRYSGQDDEGNAVFVGGLEIEARSGELRGPPFEAAVRKRATRITFARSFR